MFPKDATTESFFLEGEVSTTVTSTVPTTILGIHIQQTAMSSETDILCGAVPIARNFDTNYGLNLLQFKCDSTLSISKTGVASDAFISITYVSRDISQATEEDFEQGFVQGFTYDGVVISILSMLIFSIVIYDFLYRYVRGSKIKQ